MQTEVIGKKYLSALAVDSIYAYVSTNWTKIGNMQQSAGILLTVLSLIMTICFGYISTNITVKYIYEKIIIFIILLVSLMFLLFAFIFLFKIISPKKVKGEIDSFYSLNKAINRNILVHKEEEDAEVKINLAYISVFDEINKNLREIIIKNQNYYSYCIKNAIISFIGCFYFIIYLLFRFICDEISLFNLYCYFLIFMVSILLSVIFLLIIHDIKEFL
jgi:hypothetical protein